MSFIEDLGVGFFAFGSSNSGSMESDACRRRLLRHLSYAFTPTYFRDRGLDKAVITRSTSTFVEAALVQPSDTFSWNVQLSSPLQGCTNDNLLLYSSILGDRNWQIETQSGIWPVSCTML